MYRKPIGPTAHGIIDYAFATLNTLAPTLFGLKGPAKAICYGFAATQGTPERVDGHTRRHEEGRAPADARQAGDALRPGHPAPAVVTGAFKQRNARLYFGAFFAMAATNYMLTDYNAYEPEKSLPGGQELAEAAVAEFT